ncbi:hypothetical protein [Streptomyces oceani]|uniref:hypothetical protein n=1 Tax=Streptomyces oceani TaxID=1075402 RepID=UPI0009A0EE48|nr:hypothetical protein [Streptomyces oceani]
MNMQEAAEYADKIISDTFSGVEPSISWMHGESTSSSCSEFNRDETGAGSVTRRAVVMTEISAERRGNFLGVVERNWKKSGHEITSVRRHEDNPAIFAATPEDFRMSLEVGYKGQVFVDVVTPCMKKSEVSSPQTEANGPNYSGKRPPTPNVHSDFWSAKTPVQPRS